MADDRAAEVADAEVEDDADPAVEVRTEVGADAGDETAAEFMETGSGVVWMACGRYRRDWDHLSA